MLEEDQDDDAEKLVPAELPEIAEDGRAPGSTLPVLLGEYQLIEVAGRGGMGEVWLARHVSTRKRFAIKVLRQDLVGDEVARARFVQEARVMEALVHPNILRVNHVDEQEAHLYFVMEWVEGGTVADLLQKRGTFTLQQARDVLWQMIDGLSHAYDRGLVHRDVKPGNVLLKKDRDVKITDFGIAKFLGADPKRTGSNVRLGSPWYMSPEQIRGDDVDHRSDIYSLGITLYQLLNGNVPFDGELISVLYRHVHAPLPVTFELEHFGNGAVLPILRKMTAKDPEDRYQTYDDLQFAITRLGDVVEGSGRLTPAFGMQSITFKAATPASGANPSERLDTFHDLETVPLDKAGGVSLAGFQTLTVKRSASGTDMEVLGSSSAGGMSPSALLSGAVKRAKTGGGDSRGEQVSGGRTSLVLGICLFALLGTILGGAFVLQRVRPDLAARFKPKDEKLAEGLSNGTAPPAAPARLPTATKAAPTPAMQPLPLADQPTSTTMPRGGRISIQGIGARLIGTDPLEVERVLGTPEFTDETQRGGGMYYSTSQWATYIYDERTSAPVQRVKVLFFNGECTEIQGI